MLRQRIITGLILAPLVLSALLWMPSQPLAFLLAVFAMIGAWEWASMVLQKTSAKIAFVALCVGFMAFSYYWLTAEHYQLLMLLMSIYWVFALVLLSFYEPGWLGSPILRSFLKQSGYFIIVSGWLALIMLHKVEASLLLYFFLLIWVADIAAYFAGKRFGRNKLAAELSPGKTREGVLGALIGTSVFAVLAAQWFEYNAITAVYFVLLSVFSALISVVGDLFESLLKRNAGVKDSGSIFPGHGGVLDRIDSLLAAAPGFVLGLTWL